MAEDNVEAAEDEDGLQGPSFGPEEQPSKVMCVQWTCQDSWQIKVIVLAGVFGAWRRVQRKIRTIRNGLCSLCMYNTQE